jgi:hypothetical protein
VPDIGGHDLNFIPVKTIFCAVFAAILLGIGARSHANPAISPDLLYYPFLENQNNTDPTNVPLLTADASGNGTTGRFFEIDNVDWVDNQISVSNALHFAGVNSYIATSNNTALYSFTTNGFSVGLIIHPYGSDWLPLIGNVNPNNPNQYGWYVAESSDRFEIHLENNGTETVAQQANFPASGWECATLSVQGTNVSISCNGLTPSMNYYLYNGVNFTNPAPSATPLQFCELAPGVEDLDGDLSAVGIWGHALSFYEQQEWFNANMPNLIEEWKLWGNTADSSFYSNAPAALAGNPSYVNGPDGITGHALYLSGNQYLSQTNYTTYPVTSFGLSFWINPNPISGEEDLFQWADDGRQQYAIQTGIWGPSGTLYCKLSAGNSSWFDVSSLPVHTGQWNHVEISWFGWQTNNDYPIFRINGVLDTNLNFSSLPAYAGGTPPPTFPAVVNSLNGVPFNFGLRADNVGQDGNPYQGAVSDVQLYVNGQSDDESSLIYNSMVSSNYEGHIGPPFAGSIEVLPNLAVTITNPAPSGITPDLLYYPILENENNTFPTNVPLLTADASGNGTTGSFYEIDAIDWVADQLGASNAVHFHGIDSYIATTNNAYLYSFTTNAFSVGLVIHPYGSTWLPLLGNVNSNNASEYGWYVAVGNNDFEMHLENNGTETVAQQNGSTVNGWSCVALAVSGTNVSICCNGVMAAINYYLYNGVNFTNAAPSSSPLQFCELAPGVQDLDGDLAAVGVWGRALTFYEQQEWFNANMPNLIEEWKLWGNTVDSSFYSNAPAVLVGNPGYTNGPDHIANHALYLTGNQYLSQSHYSTYPVSSFGLSFWIKPSAINGEEDLFQWADDASQQYAIQTGIWGPSGTLYCRLWNDQATWFDITSLPVHTGQWNHVEISWFGWQTNNCYPIFRINGVVDTNLNFSSLPAYGGLTPPANFPQVVNSLNGVPFNFGLRADNVAQDGNPYQGAVSDVQLYVNGQSDDETSLIYNSMVSSNYAGHIGPPFTGSIEVLPNLAVTITNPLPAVNLTPTNLVFSVSNNVFYLSWPADHIGWQLQAQTNSLSVGMSTNWVNCSSSTTTNLVAVPVNPANGTVFYRLIYSQ